MMCLILILFLGGCEKNSSKNNCAEFKIACEQVTNKLFEDKNICIELLKDDVRSEYIKRIQDDRWP